MRINPVRSTTGSLSRRDFLKTSAGAAAAAPLLGAAAGFAAESPTPESKPEPPQRKIKLGWVGCGSRGHFLSPLFKNHGGFELSAAADYFPQVVAEFGQKFGVDPGRQFSGLSGYKRVIESGVEAIVLETPPCFFPEHAAAAAEAGLHVYLAKPVAVDVPGCLKIEAAGRQATEKQRVFLVDYQLPTDPMNIQVAERVWREEKGKLVKATTIGVSGTRPDRPKKPTIEDRLSGSVWDNDIALGGSSLVSYDIHAIDAALWLIGQRPVEAVGRSRVARPNAYSDGPDVVSVIYEYADGLIHEHTGMALANGAGRLELPRLQPFGPRVRLLFRQAALPTPWPRTRSRAKRTTASITGRPATSPRSTGASSRAGATIPRSAGRWTAA